MAKVWTRREMTGVGGIMDLSKSPLCPDNCIPIPLKTPLKVIQQSKLYTLVEFDGKQAWVQSNILVPVYPPED
jgi:hypothetical protein